jgi:hypothetical protein
MENLATCGWLVGVTEDAKSPDRESLDILNLLCSSPRFAGEC